MPTPYPDTYRERAVELYETTEMTSAQIASRMARDHPKLPTPPAGTIRMWTSVRRSEADVPTLPYEDHTAYYRQMERAERKKGRAYVEAVNRIMLKWAR